jgi:hypothetical protein
MKTRFIFFFCAVFLFDQSQGQTSTSEELAPYLYVEKTDGEQFEILFVDSEINIQDDLFLVNTPSEQYEFNYNEVGNFSFKLKDISQTSIEKVLSSSFVWVYPDEAGLLHVFGNQPLGDVSIYGTTGQLLKKVVTDNIEITIDISGFTEGMYLVKNYEKTVKIIK